MAINQLTNLDYYTQNKKHKLVLTTLTHFITYIFTFLKKGQTKVGGVHLMNCQKSKTKIRA